MRSPGSYILVRGDVTSLPAVSPMASPHVLARSPVGSSVQSPARSPVRDKSLTAVGQSQDTSKEQLWINHLEELVARTVRERERVTGCVRQQLEELEEIVVQATGAKAATRRLPNPVLRPAPSRSTQQMSLPSLLSTRSQPASPLRHRSPSCGRAQTPPHVIFRELSRDPPCKPVNSRVNSREASPMQRSAGIQPRHTLDSSPLVSPLRGRPVPEPMNGRALFLSRASHEPHMAPASILSVDTPLPAPACVPQRPAPRTLTPPPSVARVATPRIAQAPSLARWAVTGGALVRQPSPLVRSTACPPLWRSVAPMPTG